MFLWVDLWQEHTSQLQLSEIIPYEHGTKPVNLVFSSSINGESSPLMCYGYMSTMQLAKKILKKKTNA